MLRNRINYWTCSKLADFIRGEKKPFALEWRKWDEYYKDLKSRKPIRYWITEKFLKVIQNIVYYPYDLCNEIKFYIHNRWIDKTHYLKTGLKPGGYYEFDERVLHGLFNELVDYVEMELAHLSLSDQKKKYKFKNGRCVEAAYDYFKWANHLTYGEAFGTIAEHEEYGKLTDQAVASRKIKELYEWWKNIRPHRPNPHIASEYNKAFADEDRIFHRPLSEGQQNAIQKMHNIEESYNNEDTEMLIELIKLRHSLWT